MTQTNFSVYSNIDGTGRKEIDR